MRDRGLTIIIIEHLMKLIMTISHRSHCLNYGRIVLSGTGQELLANDHVQQAYLGI
jgi:ABC-type branched-subunit amino acid transport system ATPase component